MMIVEIVMLLVGMFGEWDVFVWFDYLVWCGYVCVDLLYGDDVVCGYFECVGFDGDVVCVCVV